MSGVNKVILIGRLGANPEVRTINGGQTVAHFNLATSDVWQDSNGQKQERTHWHRIVVWGKLAEICGQHLSKGRQVYVEGKLSNRSWEDKNGQKRYTTEVIGNTVQFLGSPAERESNAPEANNHHEFDSSPNFEANEEIPF